MLAHGLTATLSIDVNNILETYARRRWTTRPDFWVSMNVSYLYDNFCVFQGRSVYWTSRDR